MQAIIACESAVYRDCVQNSITEYIDYKLTITHDGMIQLSEIVLFRNQGETVGDEDASGDGEVGSDRPEDVRWRDGKETKIPAKWWTFEGERTFSW